MRLFLISISLFLLSWVGAVSAVPKGFGRRVQEAPTGVDRRVPSGPLDTNAKRLAAGLPLLPARKLWSPTASAKRWSTSPVPHTGKFGIKAANGSDLGFISASLNANGGYTIDPDASKAASLFFAAPQFVSGKGLTIKDLTSTSTNATFVGAVIPRGFALVPSTGPTAPLRKRAAANETDHITMTGVGQTSAGSSPQSIPTTDNSTDTGSSSSDGGSAEAGQDGESSVWNYDPTTNQWMLTWTNYDGSTVDSSPYYNPGSSADQSSIHWVSNTTSYQGSNPDAVPITVGFAG